MNKIKKKHILISLLLFVVGIEFVPTSLSYYQVEHSANSTLLFGEYNSDTIFQTLSDKKLLSKRKNIYPNNQKTRIDFNNTSQPIRVFLGGIDKPKNNCSQAQNCIQPKIAYHYSEPKLTKYIPMFKSYSYQVNVEFVLNHEIIYQGQTIPFEKTGTLELAGSVDIIGICPSKQVDHIAKTKAFDTIRNQIRKKIKEELKLLIAPAST